MEAYVVMAGPNSVVLITGASRGFGAELARAFWNTGASLVVTARDADALNSVMRGLSSSAVAGQSVRGVACDARADEFASRAVATAVEAFGRIDTLVCNAAMQGPIGVFWENDLEAWEETVAIDLIAPIRLIHAALPVMFAQGGSVILLSGGGAATPRPRFTAYATAKSGLVRFAETLAHELEDRRITVNCIAPGPMPTAMMREVAAAGPQAATAREAEIAASVLGDDRAVIQRAAELAVFLASPRARGITGRLISAVWDNWAAWPDHLDELRESDLYTLRRITGRDRGTDWGDR